MMVLHYCTPATQKELLEEAYKLLTENIDAYSLDSSQMELLKRKDFRLFRLKFDPLSEKSDPAEEYRQLIAPNAPDRLDWVINSIESLLFRTPFLIDSGTNVIAEVKNCAFNLLGKIKDDFHKKTDYPDSIRFFIENYLNRIIKEEFQVKKLTANEIEIWCTTIITKHRNEFEKYNEFQMRPIKRQVLEFEVNMSIKERSDTDVSFDWKATEERLDEVRDHLILKGYIEDVDFQSFKKCFNSQPIDSISKKIKWIHKQKGNLNTPGLLLDFIHILILRNLISESFQKRAILNRTIQNCFIIGKDEIPKVKDKKITSQRNWTKAIKKFHEFVSNIPSIPS